MCQGGAAPDRVNDVYSLGHFGQVGSFFKAVLGIGVYAVGALDGVGDGEGNERLFALVEFAVILPVFFLLVAGMFDFGLGIYSDLTLVNAAREGARLAAVDYPTPGSGDEVLIVSETCSRAPLSNPTAIVSLASGSLSLERTFPVVRLLSSSVVKPTPPSKRRAVNTLTFCATKPGPSNSRRCQRAKSVYWMGNGGRGEG